MHGKRTTQYKILVVLEHTVQLTPRGDQRKSKADGHNFNDHRKYLPNHETGQYKTVQ